MERFFNIAGPCVAAKHYMLPATARLPEVDRLGQSEGWLVVFDPDLTKPWDGKISTTDLPENGKTIHLVRC